MHYFSIVFAAAIGLNLSLEARALTFDETADKFIEEYNKRPAADKTTIRGLLVATEGGFGFYATALKSHEITKVTLYCQPEVIALTGEQDFDILVKGVARDKSLSSAPWQLAFLYALQLAFPCK
jgi:hypothetical protein